MILAESFADIFYNNCFNNGILPIKIQDSIVQQLFEYSRRKEEIEIKICKLYNLDDVFINEYFGFNIKLIENNSLTIYNHISQNMSKLEQTMSKHIKPGGNCKDIPLSINSSKRVLSTN